jgi:cell division protease FtsH
MLLAGRAAEEIEFGGASIGSGLGPGSDLAQATAIARKIDLQFGWGKLGPFYVEPTEYSPYLVGGVVEAIVARLRGAHERARTILEAQAPTLRAIASELAEAGYLSGEDIDRIILAQAVSTCPAQMLASSFEMRGA